MNITTNSLSAWFLRLAVYGVVIHIVHFIPEGTVWMSQSALLFALLTTYCGVAQGKNTCIMMLV